MPAPIVFWMSLAGVVFLIAGMFAFRREVQAAAGLDKWIALGSVFVAAPLATFGAEHLTAARSLMEAVPEWMPGRLFWAYVAGAVLIASGVCLVANKKTREAATYLGVMILLLVLFEYLPMLIANPKDIVSLNYFFDTLAFSGAALVLAEASGEPIAANS